MIDWVYRNLGVTGIYVLSWLLAMLMCGVAYFTSWSLYCGRLVLEGHC